MAKPVIQIDPESGENIIVLVSSLENYSNFLGMSYLNRHHPLFKDWICVVMSERYQGTILSSSYT
jgi:hypothetical protein